MTTRDALLSHRKYRVGITGPKGCGKSCALVAAAQDVASAGGQVIALDLLDEAGMVDELLTLPDKTLNNIQYKNPKTFREAMDDLTGTPNPVMVVIDALQNLRVLSNAAAVDSLIASGADSEDGAKGVLQKLRQLAGTASASALSYGRGTGLQKQYERDFFQRLWSLNCNVICAMNSKSMSASEGYIDALSGWFDLALELDRIQLQSGKYEFRYVIEKVRGVEMPSGMPVVFKRGENIVKAVTEKTRPSVSEIRPFHCNACNKDVTVNESRTCIDAAHELVERSG